MLELQIKRFENKESRLKFSKMANLITSLKKELPWLAEVSIHSLQNICKDLDQAYNRLFKGISKRPKFKSKRKAKPSFPLTVEHKAFYFKDGLVQVPKVGKLKYKADYPGLDLEKVKAFRNARISYINGKWILSFSIEYENQVLKDEDKHGSLGIDLGVGRLAVVAYEGTKREYININKTKTVRNLNRKLAHVQRILSRKYEAAKKDGKNSKQKSNQILKYEALLKRIYHKLACIRLNQRQQIARELVNLHPERIVVEDLNVKGMMKNRHLAKSIGEMGFYDFIRILEYKCEELGIELIKAGRFYPSSKTCSHCGGINKGLKLSDRIFICPDCGFVIDRDYNAAINLMNYSNSL
jgi:putative transposase